MKKFLKHFLILTVALILWIAVYQVWLITNADATCGDWTRNEWLSQCDCDPSYYRPWEWFQCEFDDPGFMYYSVDLQAIPSTWWTVEWAWSYEESQEATIYAIPNTWYVFSGWRWHGDNSRILDDTHIFEVWGDQEFTAYFTYVGEESIDRAAIYSAVYTALDSSGIYCNLNSVTNDNVTNFPWLYFSSVGNFGDITFQTGLDLTNADIQSFLQTLPNNLSITNGYVNFTPTGIGSGLNIPAKIFFALGNNLPPFIGTGLASDYIIAKDSNDNILSGIDLDGLFANDGILQCDRGEWYYCEFYVNHFTSFELTGTVFNCANVTDVTPWECTALVDLYNATDGDNRDDNNGWLTSYSVCDRYDVYCDDAQEHVIWIELEENYLAGAIPASISGLTYLEIFNIYDNEITSLPDSIWELSNLTSLEFSNNLLTSLPETIGDLTQLTEIYGYGNHLTSLPDSISNLSSLGTLDVSDNRLSSINLSGLTSLENVNISSNLLTTIWDEITNLDLQSLFVDNNCRDTWSMNTGTVDGINTYLDNISRQSITNPICNDNPDEAAALTDLYNATDGPTSWDTNTNWLDRSVSICDWYGVTCSNGSVYTLALPNNYLSGAIPSSFWNLTQLSTLNLQGNQITSLPQSFSDLVNLNLLDLRSNQIGSLPTDFWNLIDLERLFLQDNQLTSLPESFGNLTNLPLIRLDNNWLTTLPESFSNLSNLWRLTLYENCIWTWRLSTGVYNYLFVDPPFNQNNFIRWEQFHCAIPYIIASEYIGDFEDSRFDSWFFNNVLIYDYLPTGVSFGTWDEGSLLAIYSSGFDIDTGEELFLWDLLWIPTYNATLEVVSGTWDGILYAPRTTNLNPVLGEHGLPDVEDSTGTRELITVRELWASWATLIFTGNNSLIGDDNENIPAFAVGMQLTGHWYATDNFNRNSDFVIYRSDDGESREQNTPLPFCIGFLQDYCLFASDRFSYFAIVQETPNRSEVYWPIRSGLVDQGIDNNFNEVNNENITGFSNLYFEIEGVGRIEFLEPIDLSDNNVQQFLTNMYEDLSSYLNMTWWLIAFSPDGDRGTGEWLNIPAQVIMYFATYPFDQEIQADNREDIAPYITVKNSDGETITGDMLSNLGCYNESMRPNSKGKSFLQHLVTWRPRYSYCEFTTEHFTSFEIAQGDITATDEQVIEDVTDTWVIFDTDITVVITTSGTDNKDTLEYQTSWFAIAVVWGTWDGILYSPIDATGEAEFTDINMPSQTETQGNTTTTRVILMTKKVWASGASLETDGWYFTISFSVPSGTSGEELNIYRSADANTWEINNPDHSCTLDANLICNFQTDHLSYFTTLKETTTDNSHPTGGPTQSKDDCPNGDTSPSFYDNQCSVEVKCSITWSLFSTEINNSYLYACGIGITTMPTVQTADMEGKLIRSHMAKMMVNYAIKVMWMKPDTTKSCNFDDIGNQSSDLQAYIKLACQLGLMWVDMDDFKPETIVTRDQFGTILSRTLFGEKHEWGNPYYAKHLAALKDAEIMNKIQNPEFIQELRGRVMLMLMRAAE